MNEITNGEAPYASPDEVASVLAHIRAQRRPGPANTSDRWQVRIGWRSDTTWPPFTFDVKDTREEADYCARRAMTWTSAQNDLSVTGAWTRGPHASEWEAVTVPEVVPQ